MVKPLRGECEVELDGQKYTLRLGIGELEELDNVTGLGTLELLRSFGSNAKVSNMITVLQQALPGVGKDKKLPRARVVALVDKAGFKATIEACLAILTAVLVDPNEGNAEEPAAETGNQAAE